MCAFHLSVFVGAEKCDTVSTLTLNTDSAARTTATDSGTSLISHMRHVSRNIAEQFYVVLMKSQQKAIIAISYLPIETMN